MRKPKNEVAGKPIKESPGNQKYAGVYYRWNKAGTIKTYSFNYYVGKKLVWKTVGDAPKVTKSMCVAQRNDKLKEVKTGTLTEDSIGLTMQRAFEIYHKSLVAKNAPSAAHYLTAWNNHIKNELGDILISKLTSERIMDWQDYLRENTTCQPQSLDQNYLMLLKQVFNHMIARRKYLGVNPFIWVKNFKKSKATPRKRWMKAKDVKVLFNRCDELGFIREKRMAAVSLFAGLRFPSEVQLLTRECVNFAENHLIVGYDPNNTKTGQGREVPMVPALKIMFKEMFAENLPRPMESLFPILNRGRWAKLLQPWNIGRDPHIRTQWMSPYNFRHTYASTQLANDVQPKALQKLMGHASLLTTLDTYAHLDVKKLQEAGLLQAEAMERDGIRWG